MSVASGDGTITLKTKIDTDGVKKGTKSIKNAVKSTSKEIGSAFGSVFKDMLVMEALKFFTAELSNAMAAAKEFSEDLSRLKTAFATTNHGAKAGHKTFKQFYAILGETDRAVEATNHLAQFTTAVEDLSKWEMIAAGVTATFGDSLPIEGLTEASNETVKVGRVTGVLADALNWIGISEDYFNQQLTNCNNEQERSILLTNTLYNAYLAQGQMYNQLNADLQANRLAYLRLQEAVAGISAVWLPVQTILINGLAAIAELASIAAKNIAAIFGKDIDTSAQQITVATSGAVGNTGAIADNMKDVARATKKAGKEAKKQLAAFDDIKTISSGASGSSGGAGSGGAGAGGAGVGAGLKEGAYDPMTEAQKVNEALAFIMGAIGLALVAVGVLLIFGGHVPAGVGFIIGGMATFGISVAALSGKDPSEDAVKGLVALMGAIGGALVALGVILIMNGMLAWGIAAVVAGFGAIGVGIANISAFKTGTIKNTLTLIMGIAAGALLALGIILIVFNGPSPWAIGMILAGVTMLGVTAAQLISGKVEAEVASVIHTVLSLVCGALVVIGFIMICAGSVNPLSIGLLISGAAGLASEVAINWSYIAETLKGPIGAILALISTTLVVIAVIMLCSGVVTPLSIGLLVAGAAGLAAAIVPNWDFIVETLRGPFGAIMALVGTALIVIGIILLFTGAGIPLGIGLIAAGGASLAAAIAPNWNFIVDKVKDIWGSITGFWNTNIAPWFTVKKWADLVGKIGTGLKNGFKDAINGVISIVEKGINWIINKINTLSWEVPDWVPGIGGSRWGFNFKSINIPRLAQGAVIPPNREFLAVLGDQKRGVNIETPLETMIQAFEMAMNNRGSNNEGNTTVIIEIDGREFGRAVVKHGNNETRRVGARLVTVR